jgi:hypothetical protein
VKKYGIKKILCYSSYVLIAIVVIFAVTNYLFYGTPYSTEENCNKIETGDSFIYVIWKLGIPSYTYKKDDIKVMGYPIPFASYAKIPKNEIFLSKNRVTSKVCMDFK